MSAGGGILSRRDVRTQPGVLTPGTDLKIARPEGAEDIRSAVSCLRTNRLVTTFYRPFSIPNPADAVCNSDLAEYSNTPARTASRRDAGGPTLHHSSRPDSRTSTRTQCPSRPRSSSALTY